MYIIIILINSMTIFYSTYILVQETITLIEKVFLKNTLHILRVVWCEGEGRILSTRVF